MKRLSTCFTWLMLLALALTAWAVLPAVPAHAATEWPTVKFPLMGIGGMLSLRGLYTREAIIRYLQQLPVLVTPVMDTVFTYRPQQPLPLIGADIVQASVRAMPLARRGGRSISIAGGSGSTGFYEPFPIHPDISVTAADLNNLKTIEGNQASLDAWAQGKTDILRRVVRATTEAICATSLSGKLQWPVQLEGGAFETFEVDYGTILSYTPAKKWDANDAKIKDVFVSLRGMHKKLKEKGYGGKVEIWVGEDAYNVLFGLAEAFVSTAQFRVEITDMGINIGGYLVKPRDEMYYNPQTKLMVPIVTAKKAKMIALDAGHLLPYAALDDLDANLQPLPFFVKPIKTDNPSGYQLVGQAKPLPVVNVDGICDATVLA
jgi:hypothetical protein